MRLTKPAERTDMNIKRVFAMNSRSILALALCLAWLPLSAASQKHSADLDSASGSVNVVITYNQTPPATHFQKIVAAQGAVQAILNHVNAVAATIPVTALSALESDGSVTYIAVDRAVKPTLDFTTAAVDANVAFQSGFTGAGVGIAIVDSGVNPHPDLNNANGSSRPQSRGRARPRFLAE